ncbi:hypothetical protein EEJ42_10290, partial [Streptomyces botrytidirepellens]
MPHPQSLRRLGSGAQGRPTPSPSGEERAPGVVMPHLQPLRRLGSGAQGGVMPHPQPLRRLRSGARGRSPGGGLG